MHGEPDQLPEPLEFADAITADHKILNEDDESRMNDRVALIIVDRYTRWMQGFAAQSKEHSEIVRDLQRFLGPQTKPKHVYTDNSKEFITAMKQLNWTHDTSTPHRPQTNGVVERAVRVIKEGTTCSLVQSGLADKWWPEAMHCFCFLRNVSVVMETGKTAYQERFASDFTGPLIPFGAAVHYDPITDKDRKRTRAFGDKMLTGLFLGYHQQAGGGWSGDLLLIDAEEVAAATHFSDIHIKRFKAAEVSPILKDSEKKDSFCFPLAEGKIKQPGTSHLTDPQATMSDPFGLMQGPSSNGDEGTGGSPPTIEDTASPEQPKTDPDAPDPDANPYGLDSDEEEQQEEEDKDFWSFNGEVLICHHIRPRSTLFVPTDETCPIPIKWIDVMRYTTTDLENDKEKRILDCWNIKGNVALSDSWVGQTRFYPLFPLPPIGWEYVFGRKTKIQKTTRPGHLWVETWNGISDRDKKKAIQEWKDTIGPEIKEAHKQRGFWFVPKEEEQEYKTCIDKVKAELSPKRPPAMPLIADGRPYPFAASVKASSGQLDASGSGQLDAKSNSNLRSSRPHVERIAPRGHASEEWFACVHTPLPIPKAMQIPEAREALEKGWSKLERKKAWDISRVAPKAKVIRDAKAKGRSVHFGSLMDLCHIKNSQMGKEFWSYKGRIVFRGDIVKDEDGMFAVFTEQGASASNMAAAKFMDAIARMPGCDGEDSDAIGAYTQVRLSEAPKLLGPNVVTETWISLPPHRRPKSWSNIKDPVCPLNLNLYGHPLAALLWDLFQESILLKVGFEKVQSWECLYYHRAKRLFLSAYVDDYKMAGIKENIAPMWELLRSKGLDLEPAVPSKSNVYLGCAQRELEPDYDLIHAKREMMTRLCGDLSDSSGHGKLLGDDLPELLDNADFTPSTKTKRNKKKKGKSNSPIEASEESYEALNRVARGNSVQTKPGQPKVSAFCYEMPGHCAQTVDKYLELSGKSRESLKIKAPTPCIDDHLIPPEEFEVKGVLSEQAARIVLKALYVARIARYDFLWTVNILAREVTRWTIACDRRLHRLICYMHQTGDWAQVCFVGDSPSDCRLALFSDASFAGDLRDSKSTSGVFMCLVGPNTYVPICWMCKKQGAVSHSTAEAEVIALDAGVRMEGLPALTLWSLVIDVFEPTSKPVLAQELTVQERLTLRRQNFDVFGSVDYVPPSLPTCLGKGKLFLLEDNDAVLKMVVKGRSPNLRHVGRTHRVNLDWLFERLRKDPGVFMKWVGTKEQLGDILTKGSFTADAWKALLSLSLMLPPAARKYTQDLKPLK